ncbi:MAG: hypothetical protein R3E35_06050 [Rhodocyclaceae bacterium]
MNTGEKSVPAIRRQGGAALLIFAIILVMGALTYLLSGFSPDLSDASRERKTQEALAQAREALIGYALKYRESQPDRMYGYLPLPDLGSSRNNNVGCTLEGCDANTFTGLAFDANGIGPSVVGRFPWRTLGTGPLRDANGECLWLIVSSLHSRIHAAPFPYLPPMNWDTLGQFDIVVANGGAALASALAGAHERPVAVVFSPGPPLTGQNRSPSATDDVTACGGNYDARNYLDPFTATELVDVTNYLAGANSASGASGDSDPSNDPDTPKKLTAQGKVFSSGGNFLPNACQAGDCTLLANDQGLPLTVDTLFGALRRNAYFRSDINSMLDRMVNCLRDKFVAGGFVPAPIGGYAPPADKNAGRIPNDTCYDGNQPPLGYYDHYREMIFVAKPNSGTFTVNGDATCAGVLIFAGQRGAGQQRVSVADRDLPANYLEGANLASFTGLGGTFGSAGGPTLFEAPPQAAEQDIARCIPGGSSYTPVTSQPLTDLGFDQIVDYDAATRTLTLGRENVTTGNGADANALFGCAWFSDARSLGGGLRTYFRFQFKKVGTSVGLNGFVYALADGLKNNLTRCGAAGSHLGYSGNNGVTGMIEFPKIGIEFDQSRNAGFSEVPNLAISNPGRNDPCGTSGAGCAGVGYNSHAAIVYWGHEAPNFTDSVTLPNDDDNVHGYPTAPSLAGPPRPPRSHADPTTETGIEFVNLRGDPDDSRLYHVRVELTPTARNVDGADARLSNTVIKTEAWIQASPGADQLAALKNTTRPMSLLYPGYAATLSDTATLYDVALTSSFCDGSTPCPSGQACGSDNMCYRPALEKIQLGFTGSQRTQDQQVEIYDFFTTWLP